MEAERHHPVCWCHERNMLTEHSVHVLFDGTTCFSDTGAHSVRRRCEIPEFQSEDAAHIRLVTDV